MPFEMQLLRAFTDLLVILQQIAVAVESLADG